MGIQHGSISVLWFHSTEKVMKMTPLWGFEVQAAFAAARESGLCL